MIQVAMAFILDSTGKVLIAKRALHKSFGGLWEFPGGKLENLETPGEAICRELQEELDIVVEVVHVYRSYSYSTSGVSIEFYPIQCRIIEGVPIDLEHEELRMVSTSELATYSFAPPDYLAIEIFKDDYKNLFQRAVSRSNSG